ncbi:MAG: DUF3551 domain-containing protein [Afipia sp.]|jgi:hypothetical protein|nr:DUF3551 domain-containing protein [Afipia sp.]
MRISMAAVLASTLAGLIWSTLPAQARNYRYCLYEHNDTASDCAYDTYAQCAASASGRVAYCNINPMYTEPAKPPRHRRKPPRDY